MPGVQSPRDDNTPAGRVAKHRLSVMKDVMREEKSIFLDTVTYGGVAVTQTKASIYDSQHVSA
jgi:hypothetical protein